MPDRTPTTEPADAGQDHDVPADLLELHGILEYQEHMKLVGDDPTIAPKKSQE